jgi:hypothetical protein
MTGFLSGWLAFSLIPVTAVAGWSLRRFVRGSLAARMRPHFALGYAALALALLHLSSYMGAMRGANASGLWFATLATLALVLQALLGSNLQSPGLYRLPLRRWHLGVFIVALTLAGLHVVYDAAWSPVAVAR